MIDKSRIQSPGGIPFGYSSDGARPDPLMRTDTIFYQLFQTFPDLLFELLGLPAHQAQVYEFASPEIKELTFRLDGMFLPTVEDRPLYCVEVQFQPKADFYWDLLTETFLYLGQYRPVQDWRAVAIFAYRSLDPGVPMQYRGLVQSGQLQVVYLEDLLTLESESVGVRAIQIILEQKQRAQERAVQLIEHVKIEAIPRQQAVLELLEKILIYKFNTLTREEIEAMFSMDELKQTRYIQDLEAEARERGIQIGEQRGKQKAAEGVAIKMLAAGLDPDLIASVTGLTLERIQQLQTLRT